MTLEPGACIGPYEVVAPLGAGGMGEVYRARDSRLERDVAIKVLPEEFAQDAERLARFEREARLLASLSHPNIAGIYGLEESGTSRYLVLELVDGETLAARLSRAPLPVEDALQVCLQVATAVEAAHEAGIVHRDLKPGNVMIRADGTVKVLDFGLAKGGALGGASSELKLTASPTATYAATSAGVVLGTAAYMSPEQARGKNVDRRTDIWSFGCVLYECLAGRQLFAGETVSDIIARILQTSPDLNVLPPETPLRVSRLIERCLTKDPKRRLRDIGEARIALESPADEPTVQAADAPSARRRVPLPLALAAALVLAIVGAGTAWMLKPSRGKAPMRVFDLVADDLDAEWYLTPLLSPDGSRIAYCAASRIWVRDLDRREPRAVADLDVLSPLLWSPDGRSIAYASRTKLWKTAVDGGSPVAIADIPETGSIVGGAWGEDESILIAVWRGGLYRVSTASGRLSLIVAPDPGTQVDFHYPSFLPDGGILCVAHWKSLLDGSGKRRPFLQVLREGRSHGADLDLIGDDAWPVYQSGRLFFRGGSNTGLFMVGFDPSTAQVRGDPLLVVPGASSFSLANDGSLLYVESAKGAREHELGRIDRSGAWRGAIGPQRIGLGGPALSPDGRRIAFAAGVAEDREIWIHDLSRNTDTRLTFESGSYDLPRWLDNDRILYTALPAGMSMNSLVVMRNADGSGTPRTVSGESSVGTGSPIIETTPDLTRFLQIIDAAGRGELRLIRIADKQDAGEPSRVLREDPEPNVLDVRMSPNGRFLAYVVDDAGQPEVFLTRFPSGDGKWQVSLAGGRLPRWDREGKTLYFVAGTGPSRRSLDAVEVDPAAAVPLGARQTLFVLAGDGIRSFALDAGYEVESGSDGFFVVRPAGGASQWRQRMIFIQNWPPSLAGPTTGPAEPAR